MSCIFPDGVVKDRVCKEIWLGHDAATLEKLPGVDTVVEYGLKPTGYSAKLYWQKKKKKIALLLKVFSRDSTDLEDVTDMAEVMQLAF